MIGVGCGSPRGGGGGSTPTLTINVYSDSGLTMPISTADFGDTVYIKSTPTGIAPSTHTFFFGNGSKNAPQVTQAGDTLAWTVSLTGSVIISATATDGTDATADATPFTLTSNVVINQALKLDGVNDYALAVPKVSNELDWSISCRFKLNSLAGKPAIFSFIKNDYSRQSFGIYYKANEIYFLSWPWRWSFSAKTAWVGDLLWHSLIVTHKKSTNSTLIYIDGVLIGSDGYNISQQFDLLILGRSLENNYYGNVYLADFNIHESTLTTGEVATLQTLGETSASSVQRYIFSETLGTTTGQLTDIVSNQTAWLRNITSPNGIVTY